MTTKILVAEDDKYIRELISFRLKNLGYDVVAVNNGEKALTYLRDNSPDLVLLDIMMPLASGKEVLLEMKKDVRTASIPVVFLTAQSLESEVIEGLEIGAEDYITKPFSPAELAARVHTVLARRKKK